MRQIIVGLLIGLLFLGLAGCGKRNPNTYISKRGEYTLQYPSGWKMVDDERKLTKTREKANKELAGPVKFEFNPDVVFASSEKLGGMVVMSPAPLGELGTGMSADDETRKMEMLDLFSKGMGLSPRSSEIRMINGKKFKIDTVPGEGGVMSVSAMCFHNDHLYMFLFSSGKSEFEKWKPSFNQFLNSVSFREDELKKAKKVFEESKAGFFTGLWHGGLLPVRWIASFIWNIDIYEDHNKGTTYMIGFIIGILLLVGVPGAGGAGRSRR